MGRAAFRPGHSTILAVKFYTEDGNWDLVGNNLAVFFIRDAVKSPTWSTP